MVDRFIIRERHKSGFSVLSNKIWDDNSLSVEAKGALGYLLSRPPNWRVRLTQVARKLRVGRDRLYRIVNECIQAGYVVRQQEREAGAFKSVAYYVRDVPRLPDTDLPGAVQPKAVHPATADKEALLRNENSTRTDSRQITSSNKAAPAEKCRAPTTLRADRAGPGKEVRSCYERPEVTQARLAHRLGLGDVALGWTMLSSMGEMQLNHWTERERNRTLSDSDIARMRRSLLDAMQVLERSLATRARTST